MDERTSRKESYTAILNQITQLHHHDRYEGAFVFGSYVANELHEESDLDIVVLITDLDSCLEVSHPRVNGVPIDISFYSFAQIQNSIQTTLAQGFRRKPWLYDSQILFDKRGRLQALASWVQEIAQPTKYSEADYEDIQLSCYYFLAKAQKLLKTDSEAALLVMFANLDDLLRYHYRIHSRWRVADKKILSDLKSWDATMAQLLRNFLRESTIGPKFTLWQQMIIHVLASIGGHNFAKYTAICSCERCQRDLQTLFPQRADSAGVS